ncbi:hypothetical protein [Microbacterium sp. 69-10]|uniref:hypothetical protein n=1 Tax=Microbacterium sp. 69-10 TaxID=1895783 RepID=UPI0025CDCA96|nr:hypothetical protein [Microbacterium sp. 69-10]
MTAGARVTTRCYSPNIELHWSPSNIGSEEWAVVSPVLGARDWRGIDPLPARLSKGVKGASIPALYYWQRTVDPEWVWWGLSAKRWIWDWPDRKEGL